MISADNIVSIVGRLGLRKDQFVVGGSAVMVLAGIERAIGDLDVFCSTEEWFAQGMNAMWKMTIPDRNDPVRRCDPPILSREMPIVSYDEAMGFKMVADMHRRELSFPSVKVDLFYSWKQRGRLKAYDRDGNYPFIVQDFIAEPDVIRGVPTTGLDFIYNWKRVTRRPKDIEDVKLIERTINGQEGLLHPTDMERFCAEAR